MQQHGVLLRFVAVLLLISNKLKAQTVYQSMLISLLGSKLQHGRSIGCCCSYSCFFLITIAIATPSFAQRKRMVSMPLWQFSAKDPAPVVSLTCAQTLAAWASRQYSAHFLAARATWAPVQCQACHQFHAYLQYHDTKRSLQHYYI